MRFAIKICFSILLLLFVACRSGSVTDRESVSRSGFVERITSDSVVVHDSIYVREKADTVYVTRYRTCYRERLSRDTIFCSDTIYKERRVTVPAKRNLTYRWWLFLLLLLLLWRVGFFEWLWRLVKRK